MRPDLPDEFDVRMAGIFCLVVCITGLVCLSVLFGYLLSGNFK
jgi:hypothetical protein